MNSPMNDTYSRTDGDLDVVVVGAGFSGLYAVHRIREKGLSVRGIERGSDVGGTWFWNRYPGARCDAESIYYSYSFDPQIQQEWNWTEKFATQPEILSYLKFVADRLDLRREFTFDTSVDSAHFDESSNTWTVTTDRGETIRSRFVMMATGCLSAGRIPDIFGAESFAGETYHTGAWPHEGVDFSDKRVAVIGTGSSGIQVIPQIAAQARELLVLQRTANFSVPAQNAPLTDDELNKVKARYPEMREASRWSPGGAELPLPEKSALDASEAERTERYEAYWARGGPTITTAYTDIMVNKAANDTLADFVRHKIDEIVDDPDVAEILKPIDHAIGTKRVCVDTDYYATFNRDNVRLVDIRRHPIEAVDPSGIRTTGEKYDVDAIVYATGFDAMTGALTRMDIRGTGGVSIAEKWEDGPKTYLGVAIHDFPNLFIVTGPGSPSVLSNVVTSIEQHVEWITDHIEHLVKNGLSRSEVQADAQEAWIQHVNDVADMTLFPQGNSWYIGANIPGKPRVFMPYVAGVGVFRAKCDEVAAQGYQGFALQP